MIEEVATSLLKAGISVVFDFGGNSPEERTWCKAIIDQTACDHQLIFVNVPKEVCWRQVEKRNAEKQDGTYYFTMSREEFDHATSRFRAPSPAEGFNVVEIVR